MPSVFDGTGATMKLMTLASLALIAALGTSCVGTFTGGGFIPGRDDATKKATFGFVAHADDTNGDDQADSYRGQFQYNDHSNGVKLNVSIDSALIADPDPILNVPTVRIGGRTATGGFFSALVEDHGPRGMSATDRLTVTVFFDPVIGFYVNSGTIGGGQVTYHPAK